MKLLENVFCPGFGSSESGCIGGLLGSVIGRRRRVRIGRCGGWGSLGRDENLAQADELRMLRTMLKDAAEQEKGRKTPSQSGVDEPFVRALRKVRERYEGKSVSTAELLEVFVEELPSSLQYEGKNSLDWFLTGWINGTSMPRLELKGVRFTPKGTSSVVTGTIVQKDAPQDLVTSVPVYAASGKQLVLLGRVFADGEESTFHLTAPAGTHKIVLDPYDTVLTSPK